MRRPLLLFIVLISGLSFWLAGCGGSGGGDGSPESGQATSAGASPAEQGSVAAAEGLAAARSALQAGQVDQAAARLTRLQAEGAAFNAQQARDYRAVLSEAYDRAIEGAQRGDPQAQAALQLLRAAAPR